MSGLEPAYTHDCEECVFLGKVVRSETILVTDDVASALTAHVEDRTATIADLNKALGAKAPEVFDLYFCAKQGKSLLTVIARYGDGGPDYKSGMARARVDLELALALKLARARGLA